MPVGLNDHGPMRRWVGFPLVRAGRTPVTRLTWLRP